MKGCPREPLRLPMNGPGYKDGATDTFDVYTEEGGTHIMSLPWLLFDDVPASDRTSSNWECGRMTVDVYCGTIEDFTWAVVCTGPSLGTGNANVCTSVDGGKTWEPIENTMPDEYPADSYRFTPLVPQLDGSEGVYPIVAYKWRDDGNYDQETIYMYSHDWGLVWTFK